MKVLIATNRSLRAYEVESLVRALSPWHHVTVAGMAAEAPYRGLAFTSQPTRGEETTYKIMGYKDIKGYEFYSNPADMISIMLGEVMKHTPPDIVICGISNGTNMGPDVYSSSNVGMAIMSTMLGVPAVVIATEHREGGNTINDLAPVAKFIERNLEKLATVGLPPHTLLNINAPRVEEYEEYAGIKYTRMGKMNLRLEYVERTDSRDKNYFWSKFADRENIGGGEDDDKTWYDRGYISITPICYDATDTDAIENWGKVIKEITTAKEGS